MPGRKQVYRCADDAGLYSGDTIALATEPPPRDATPLLDEVMRDGRILRPHPTLDESRATFTRNFEALPEAYKALRGTETYPIDLSPALTELQTRITKAVHPGPR